MKTTLALLLCICAGPAALAQPQPAMPLNGVLPKIKMEYKKHDNVQFSALLRPLKPIASGYTPHYTFFWEFGDGTFIDRRSKSEEAPLHRYQKSGVYQVSLFATNNYDNGEASSKTASFPVRVTVPAATNWTSELFEEAGRSVIMKSNRNPRHDEEFVAYIGYRNTSPNKSISGSLVIFFDEYQFAPGSFSLTGSRTYHGEVYSSLNELSSRLPNEKARTTLRQLQGRYRENCVLRFTGLPAVEEHFIFLTIKTSHEMIRYTKSLMSMTACLLPDDPTVAMDTAQLIKPLLASHDPNQLALEPSPIKYRRVKKAELTYRVRFKNTGEGAADSIAIAVNLPRQLNRATLQVKRMSPAPAWCSLVTDSRQSCVDTVKTADSIHFLFRHINLPGTKQAGISNDQATNGFVEYTIRFNKRQRRIPFSSQATILFDRNKPENTNVATASFTGWSPGIVAGYHYSFSHGSNRLKGPIQAGYVWAPYAPARPYLQLEAYVGILQQEDSVGKEIKPASGLLKGILPANFAVDTNTARIKNTVTKKQSVLQVVPFHLRYNISNWIGMGLGLIAQVEVFEKIGFTDEFHLTGRDMNRRPFDTLLTKNNVLGRKAATKLVTSTHLAPFVDIQVGWVKAGPVLGLRSFWLSKANVRNRFFLYVGCKL